MDYRNVGCNDVKWIMLTHDKIQDRDYGNAWWTYAVRKCISSQAGIRMEQLLNASQQRIWTMCQTVISTRRGNLFNICYYTSAHHNANTFDFHYYLRT